MLLLNLGKYLCKCFFLVSKIGGGGGGVYQDFLSKTFCLTVPKIFVGEPFFVSQNFWYRKNLWIRGGGGASRFSVKNFLSQSDEKIRRGTFQCVTNFGYRKILCFRELFHDLVSIFFCLTVQKNFVEELF